MRVMVRHTNTEISYAPFYIHSFQLEQTHFSVEIEKLSFTYSQLSQIDNTADKLRWCRYKKELFQRDVAEYVGIDRRTYVAYEKKVLDAYPIDKMEKIAELFEVEITDLLDGYNLFLYNGQGQKIKALRKNKGMT